MRESDPSARPTDVFVHAVVEHAPRYRAVMRAFAAAKQRFVVHLRPEDVHAGLTADPSVADPLTADPSEPADPADPGDSADPAEEPLTLEHVRAALDQLVGWGNLRSEADTARVTTVEDFNRARYLYQLTHEGEAAEQALATFEEALGRRGELQAVALADIRDRLRELLADARADEPDPGRVRAALRDLAATSDGLADNASAFLAGLQRTVDVRGGDEEAFLAYKDALVAYVERFVGELTTASPEIAGLLDALDAAGVDRLLALAAQAEAADASPDEADPVGTRLAAWRDRWRGLRQWFAGGGDRPAQAELLRRRARQAIGVLLRVVTELNERRSGRSDRAQDFRTLARWFAEAPHEADCHRLWRTAFGLAPARHLTVDADTVAARRDQPVPASTPWAEAPPVAISPRLRATGRYERRGQPNRIADRSAERRLLAERLAAEAAQTDAARRRLATDGPVRLSALGHLDREAFGLFLDLLGEALTRPCAPGEPVRATTGDGALAITLTPTGDGGLAEIPTDDGVLRGPDHLVEIALVRPGVAGPPDSEVTAQDDAPVPDHALESATARGGET